MMLVKMQKEKLESDIEKLNKKIGQADFYQQDSHVIKQTTQKHKDLQKELAQKYARWEELDN